MRPLIFFLLSFLFFSCSNDVKRFCNLDESKVGNYTLPDPLVCEDGTAVSTDSLWWNKRRPELLSMFEEYVYGRTPKMRSSDSISFSISKSKDNAVNGNAIMREVDINFTANGVTKNMRMILFIPKKLPGREKKAPCFVSLNFFGNMSVTSDTSVSMSDSWMRNDSTIENNRATEKTRGKHSSRWPLDLIIGRGYAVATSYYGDLDPDFDDGFVNGIQPLFYKTGQTKPDSAEWGSIGAWAWVMSRMLDYLETDSLIDATKTIAVGHSRLGKTALWAGAQDQRFAIVISNNSGCGGAALSKRNFGENTIIINTSFPHWFCDNFTKYNQNESALPVDQHELIALIAPRPVYVASASEDQWADPKGEFLSTLNADTVYKFLHTDGFPLKEIPPVNKPAFATMGYHLREGKHDITKYDWEQYLNFADYHLRK